MDAFTINGGAQISLIIGSESVAFLMPQLAANILEQCASEGVEHGGVVDFLRHSGCDRSDFDRMLEEQVELLYVLVSRVVEVGDLKILSSLSGEVSKVVFLIQNAFQIYDLYCARKRASEDSSERNRLVGFGRNWTDLNRPLQAMLPSPTLAS